MLKERKGTFQDLNAMFVLGASSVLLLHILGYFIQSQELYPGHFDLEAIAIMLLRFGRSLFIFGTGMLLFYWYKQRRVDGKQFWRKRWYAVLLPYLIWTGIYTYTTYQTFAPAVFVPQFLHSLVTGSSFYHLYYIPVYLQLSLFFLLTKNWLERHLHLPMLLVAFLLQMGIYTTFTALFAGSAEWNPTWKDTPWYAVLHHLHVYGQLYLHNYFFYFLLGAYAGLHLHQWRRLLEKFHLVPQALLVITGVWLAARFLTGDVTYLEGLNIFHPLYLVYTLSFIAALYPVSRRLGRHPKWKGWLARVAKENMALYLVHPFILFMLESYVIFRLPLPVPLLMLLMFGVTMPLSIWLYKRTTPALAWRKRPAADQQQPAYRTHQA